MKRRTEALLQAMIESLRTAPVPESLLHEIERLTSQIDEPCVVAVVGPVKAGKSTFINALLGENLAKVGTTETTATINYFRYGRPDPARPVRCHWRGGQITDESQAFLDSLQGNDVETLRRAEGIDFLEYFVPIPLLKELTLIDTPGTGAVVEAHEQRTAEFLGLSRQLRQRHHEETQRLGSQADAVIYLVGPVARATDQTFLEAFSQATEGLSRAFNALGIMAKIDLQPVTVERRHDLCAKIAAQLKDNLNTVLPVSAGVQRALELLLQNDGAGLIRLMHALHRIPSELHNLLIASEELFCGCPFDECPLTVDERQALVESVIGSAPHRPWGVFATIARAVVVAPENPATVVEQLTDLAGFTSLRKNLEKNFLARGHILRCYRIVHDARKVLNTIKYTHLPACRRQEREATAQRDRFLSIIRQSSGDPTIVRELEAFLCHQLDGAGRVRALENLWNRLDRELGGLFRELTAYNADFQALQQLEDDPGAFTLAQVDELRTLFGLYGLEFAKRLAPGRCTTEYVRERQLTWRQIAAEAPYGTAPRAVAHRAWECYGEVLQNLQKHASA